MKEYYYLEGKNQIGPMTIEELAKEKINKETLVWTDGIDTWRAANDIKELQDIVAKKPPSPPFLNASKNSNGNRKPNTLKNSTKRNLIIWLSIHLFALLMSYSEVDIFNDGGKPRTDRFWPLVQFTYTPTNIPMSLAKEGYKPKTQFEGIFVEYDWSEFLFYAGIALLYVYLSRGDFEEKETSA